MESETAAQPHASTRLRKELGLFDVYALSTGAMFSAGFFLLPGLAAAKTGPSVVLAYVLAGLLLVPALLSLAELSTAMPRAGGIYFALDRALGPLMGTVGGFGTWLSIVFKSAFALIGMGAYLALFVDVPIRPVAMAATAGIVVLNLVGVRETTRLQRVLVIGVLIVLGLFVLQGLEAILGGRVRTVGPAIDAGPFFSHGATGFVATVGFVIVSFAGLLKVASISEEISNPDRNIPLGMSLSLGTAILVYALGVFIMVRVLPAPELYADLTPVASAGARVFHWLPESWGVGLIVIAATLAFAAMANAGLMSASRYPMAMARDHLLPRPFAKLGPLHTPTASILLTGAVMALVLALLDVESVAKLASALMLLVFALVNLAVIVMRETRIASYDPGYRSRGYPWVQLVGLLAPIWLIVEMGHAAFLFTLAMVSLAMAWYFWYARERVARGGAIFHVFERLGRQRFDGLDRELRGILKEKGIRPEDPFDDVVSRAMVIDAADALDFDDVVFMACGRIAERIGLDDQELRERFFMGTRLGDTPVAHGVALPHLRLPDLEDPEMVLVRSRAGLRAGSAADALAAVHYTARIHACVFLVSPEDDPGRHLRILAEIAGRVDQPEFMERWLAADEPDLPAVLLGEQHMLTLVVQPESGAAPLLGAWVRDLDMPHGSLIAVIHRAGKVVVPRGDTRIAADDRLTIIGDPVGIRELEARYGGNRSEGSRVRPDTLS